MIIKILDIIIIAAISLAIFSGYMSIALGKSSKGVIFYKTALGTLFIGGICAIFNLLLIGTSILC